MRNQEATAGRGYRRSPSPFPGEGKEGSRVLLISYTPAGSGEFVVTHGEPQSRITLQFVAVSSEPRAAGPQHIERKDTCPA
jgi:hypothetical protein